MENTGKNNLHMVRANWDEIEQKVREHRMKQIKWAAIIIGICVAAGIFYYVYMQHKSYTDYRIVEKVERSDTTATHFKEYNGEILKYSNDGASYTDAGNRVIWNQTFEMQNPMVSICEQYVSFADKEGKEIYVLDGSGLQGKIKVNMPIIKVEVAAQGTVAVLMEEEGVSYLALYSKSGEQLAEGAIHIENGGAPLDIALSHDGKKLGVAVLDVNDGKAKSTVNFYNFGAVGQNQIDNIVAAYSYADTVIADITYISADQMLAFADNGVYTYTGADTPKEAKHLEVKEEIKGIFYDSSYFGLAFADNNNETDRNLRIYDMKCNEVKTIHTELSYNRVQFLNNHEICLYNERQCAIYTLGGQEKFKYEFDDSILEILHAKGYRGYTFILEEQTEQVRLKLFGKPPAKGTETDKQDKHKTSNEKKE